MNITHAHYLNLRRRLDVLDHSLDLSLGQWAQMTGKERCGQIWMLEQLLAAGPGPDADVPDSCGVVW